MSPMGKQIGKQSVTIRKPQIEVWFDIWDWETGQIQESIDITKSVISYQFQKSIKTPLGSCQVTLAPLVPSSEWVSPNRQVHAMDRFSVMDVVSIYEFGCLKFQGYVKRIGASGSISQDGRPIRSVVIEATHIGGIFAEGEVGWLFVSYKMLGKAYMGLEGKAVDFVEKVSKLYNKGTLKFGYLLKMLVEEWLNFLKDAGVTTLVNFINTYIDYTAGTQAGDFDDEVVWPKAPTFFYDAQSGDISFWNEIQKIMEVPFNEVFFDEGPRSVGIKNKEINLSADKTYLIGRPTPFNGRVKDSQILNYFNVLPLQTIPLSHLVQWDFNRSMEEVYSIYVVNPSYLGLTEFTLRAMGDLFVDTDALNKFACKTLTAQLFYDRGVEATKTKSTVKIQDITDFIKDGLQTLYNWFKDGDSTVCGVITIVVPSENDICIGSRVEVEGIDGEFYCEGITHSWQYGGSLKANLNVTRGQGKDGFPIQFTDAIFVGGGFLSDRNG